MKNIFIILLLSLYCCSSEGQIPSVVSGSINRYDSFQSKFVSARAIDVWLPAGYNNKEKYNVLYMHDGQMLYDSNITWNHKAWDVDDVVTRLIDDGKISKVIVVGIWNSGQGRHADYFPQKPFEGLSQIEKDSITAQLKVKGRTTGNFSPVSDNYLKFIVTELKPFIDKKYATKTKKENTFIMGSSMGGLMSFYAICEYPNVFGGAACMSTHWPGIFKIEDNPIPAAFIKYLQQHLPNPKNHKIYFDCGNKTLDALYPATQKKVDAVMLAKGYTEQNWVTRFFDGADHSEVSWNKRLDIPLLFLLKKQVK